MLNRRINNVTDVAKWRLCLGCGMCIHACPQGHVRMRDVENQGLRPFIAAETDCAGCSACLDVCPGYAIDHRSLLSESEKAEADEVVRLCGPFLDVWEGYAADAEIRRLGSSGGILTALSLCCLDSQGFQKILHIAAGPEAPLRNKVVTSRTREELLRRTGSRYAPAAPCLRLDETLRGVDRYVFIGKPCDNTAMRKWQKSRPEARERIALSLSFFCAGSPSTRATKDLLQRMHVSPSTVTSLRYRGNGWPGHFAARFKENGGEKECALSYNESWGYLQAYRPLRCYLCPDGTGEDADISCGDAWDRPLTEGGDGLSLIVVRTDKGREVLEEAVRRGYICAERIDAERLVTAQSKLLAKRSALLGRLLTLRVLGIPAPSLRGFSLLRNWLKLPLREQLRSTLGTARRALIRGYRHPLPPHQE